MVNQTVIYFFVSFGSFACFYRFIVFSSIFSCFSSFSPYFQPLFFLHIYVHFPQFPNETKRDVEICFGSQLCIYIATMGDEFGWCFSSCESAGNIGYWHSVLSRLKRIGYVEVNQLHFNNNPPYYYRFMEKKMLNIYFLNAVFHDYYSMNHIIFQHNEGIIHRKLQ